MQAPAHSLPVYQPSGRFGARAVAVWLGAGGVSAVLCGYLLSLAQGFTTGWFTASICVVVAMIVMGVWATVLTQASHARHPLGVTLAAAVWVVVMLAVRWAFTWHAQNSDLVMAGVPWLARIPAASGALLEFMAIAGLVVGASRLRAQQPYSEDSQRWADDGFRGDVWVNLQEQADALRHLQVDGVDWILSSPSAAELCLPAQAVSSVWHTLQLQGKLVEDVSREYWLTVRGCVHSRSVQGKVRTKTFAVIENWCLAEEDYVAIKQHLATSAHMAPTPSQLATQSVVEMDASRPTPKELEASVMALEAEQYTVAYALAQPHCQHPDAEVRADAWRMCALAQARLHKWQTSFDAYHALFELEPSVLNAVQLSTTSVMAGEILRGQAWFQKACEMNEIAMSMMPVEMHMAFLSALEQAGEYEASRPHLDWLANGYRSMESTNFELLMRHRFPMFEEFLRKADLMLRMVMTESERHHWFQALREGVDENGQIAIDRHLAAA